MKLDNTKIATLIMFAVTIAKLVGDIHSFKDIDASQASIIADGIVAIGLILAGFTHHTEVQQALDTPTIDQLPKL